MKLTKENPFHSGNWLGLCVIWMAFGWMTWGWMANAQQFTTTSVQGTVYSASGLPCAGSLQLSWPAFTTASNQAVAAGRKTVEIGADGFVSVSLAANVGATPAGLYYTAIYHLSDGTTSTEYWVVPAAAQASIGQVRAQLMPAAQAVQAVSKKYVDQSIQELTQSLLTAAGGSLSGPLYLNGDPQIPTQAASKHYVDNLFGQAVPIQGGSVAGPLTSVKLGGLYQVDQFHGTDFGSQLRACIQGLDQTYGGTCDARNFTGSQSMGSDLTISTANVTVELPCATISTAHQIAITAGTRNVTFHGCGLRGASDASGSKGGTVFLYSGTGAMVQVGDPTYSINTAGFHFDNAVINTTTSSASTAQGLVAYRTQELDLASLYFLGNSNQTGVTLDGTGNYTGGTFQDDEFGGFGIALNAIGHQNANAAPTDWLNASTFVRLHINCPTSDGNPIGGTYGINLQQGDGNTFTGGDVEGCSTAVHLGLNAQNNTFVGLRNENSTYQVVADAGSSYNNWMTGGTMFTGKLMDNGTRNSFLDTFHRSFNGMNGDWYGSQQDVTLTNHYRLGIGTGVERGLQDRYQTDYGYRWTTGLSDATAGEQFYQVLDELNSVNRLSIGQYNNGQPSTNNQTVINAAGTGAVVLNGSKNAGTGGVVIGAGGAAGSTVATISNTGNAQFNGSLQVGGSSTFINSTTIKNQSDAEIDAFLWAGATTSQKESLIYKDWNGSSQWYMLKDANNNWALNSAVGGLDSIKAYQSSNSGDTYINASNPSGHVRLNYETGSGAETDIYSGSGSGLVAAFLSPSAIKLPGLASSSGRNCLQIDSSGYITNSGSNCAAGGSTGTVNSGNAGQIAYYSGNGTTVAGTSAVSILAGGTGASTAADALQQLGGQSSLPGVTSDGAAGVKVNGDVAASKVVLGNDLPTGHQAASANAAVLELNVMQFGAVPDAKSASTIYGALVASSNIFYISSADTQSFTTADIGKYISFGTVSRTPWAGGPPYIAKITGMGVDQWHVTIDHTVTAGAQIGVTMWWGTDNVPAFNACIAAVAAKGGGNCVVPAGQYFLATAPYKMYLGARDDGGYSWMPYAANTGGGTGAAITANLTGGAISGYTVTNGGSGYTPNSKLQVGLIGGCGAGVQATSASPYWLGPCGWAYALANTDAGGHVVSVDNSIPGQNFVSAPTVKVQPLNGDNAAATVTVSGGSINSTNITNSGAGYYPGATNISVWGVGGTGCATVWQWSGITGQSNPAYTARGAATANASGQVTSIAWSSPGAGCTTPPTVLFGDATCNGGQQCHNVAPLNPVAIPTQIMATNGVALKGLGTVVNGAANLISTWDQATLTNSQYIIYGGTTSDISGLKFTNYAFGVMEPNGMQMASHHDLLFWNGGISLWTEFTDLGTNVHDVSFYGSTPWINGGQWSNRVDVIATVGGFLNSQYVSNILVNRPAHQAADDAVDDWFATNVWGTPYSQNATDFPETCKQPQAAAQRQTDMMPYNTPGNIMCYRGVTGYGHLELRRNGAPPGSTPITGIDMKGGFRSIFYGAADGDDLSTFESESTLPLTGTSDPYRTSAQLEGAVMVVAGHLLTNMGWGGAGPVTQTLWGIGYNSGGKINASWSRIGAGGTTAQPVWQTENYSQTSPIVPSSGIKVGQVGSGYTGSLGAGWGGTVTNGGLVAWAADGTTRVMNMFGTGVQAFVPVTTPSITINGGTQATGTVGNGGKLQETTTATKTSGNPVAFDAAANTVNATTANISNLFCPTGTGTKYLGDDGACHLAGTGGGGSVLIPSWLKYAGTGVDGSYTATDGGVIWGDMYVTNFTVPYGVAATVSNQGATIHATNTCTIAGTVNTQQSVNIFQGYFGGSSGGAGGGTSAGPGGRQTALYSNNMGYTLAFAGSAGAASGGNGGNGQALPAAGTYGYGQREALSTGGGVDAMFFGGADGVQGANSGGLGGGRGMQFTLICGQIVGTDGTHVGNINASGGPGMPATTNNTGAGSGGGGAPVILSSQSPVTTWPNVYVAGGPGGLVTVPEAVGTSGTCTSPAKATLGVTAGGLSSCTVVQAGAGCGTGAGVNFTVLGGGGSGGTITPTWSGGNLTSCAVNTAGSGYTSSTFTTSGTGGDGGPGWYVELQGW